MKFIKTFTILFVTIILNISVQAQSKFDPYFEHIFTNRKFMGSVSMLFKDAIIYKKSVGFSDVATQQLNNDDTKFRIGSITKTYTAVMILKAREEGRLTLDDKLATWFPQFENAKDITIEMMLKHRSGIFNFTEIPGEAAWESEAHSQTEFIEYVSKPKSKFAPGTSYEYSNTNYALLGFILEKIYNQDYNQLLQILICQPLDLKNTYYTFENNPANNEAYSYNIQDTYLRNGSINYANEPGGGGILASATDVNLFVSALFKGKIISPESLELMLPKENGAYGLGIEKIMIGDLEAFRHTGRIDNYISDYWYFPEEELGLVSLANATNINTDLVQVAMLQFAYGNTPVLKDYDLIEGMNKERFLTIKGTYFYPEHPISVTISSDGYRLIFQDSRMGQMYVPAAYLDNFKFEFDDVVLTFDPEKNELLQEQGDVKVNMKKK